ncbi:MAG: hypothetical protein J6K96_09440 [Treponema sp.]|nr:hypothetical protein [Treponema sp.]
MEYTSESIITSANKMADTLSKGMIPASKFLQIATDATRLISQTEENIETVKKTGFFKRIAGLFKKNSPAPQPEQRQSQVTVIQSPEISKEEFKALQEFARKSLEVLNERNLLTADALITVKNNLNTLDVQQHELKEAVIQMAQKVSDRFNRLEIRVGSLEHSQSLLVWLEGISFDETYKNLPETIRFLKVIKDFYSHKSDRYTREQLLLVRKAINDAGINYKKEISLGDFVDSLVDELQNFDEQKYLEITKVQLEDGETVNSSQLSDLISVPSFIAVSQMKETKEKLRDTISLLESEYNLPYTDALKKSIKNDIARHNNIDMNIKMSLSDLGIELISCYSAVPELIEESKPKKCHGCGREILKSESPYCPNCGKEWRTGKARESSK